MSLELICLEHISEEKRIFDTMEKLSDCFFNRNLDRVQFSKKLARFGNFCVVYNRDEIAGFVGYYTNEIINKTGYLSTIVVSPNYQRKGVGTVLLNECLADCRNKGMIRCRLEVDKENLKAIQFYLRNGFQKERDASQRTEYYICNL